MQFGKIYELVEEIKQFEINELIIKERVELVYDSMLCYGKECRFDANQDITAIFIKEGLQENYEKFLLLHELGHYFIHFRTGIMSTSLLIRNTRKEENEANLFACLYLLKNDIWEYTYFDIFAVIECSAKYSKLCTRHDLSIQTNYKMG